MEKITKQGFPINTGLWLAGYTIYQPFHAYGFRLFLVGGSR
jgi:hypothetical protein